jgi:hypothetical protein
MLLIWLVFLDDIVLEEKLLRGARAGAFLTGADLITLLRELSCVFGLLLAGAAFGALGLACDAGLLTFLGALWRVDLCGAGLAFGADRVGAFLLAELREAFGGLCLLEVDLLRDAFDLSASAG